MPAGSIVVGVGSVMPFYWMGSRCWQTDFEPGPNYGWTAGWKGGNIFHRCLISLANLTSSSPGDMLAGPCKQTWRTSMSYMDSGKSVSASAMSRAKCLSPEYTDIKGKERSSLIGCEACCLCIHPQQRKPPISDSAKLCSSAEIPKSIPAYFFAQLDHISKISLFSCVSW